jgi:ubiquitin carboxyl-terminal hydrolase L5
MSSLLFQLKGLAISNNDGIRDAHNSFAAAEPFVLEESHASGADDSDAFHFIAYVPFNGKVYELDGLKAGPILLGDFQPPNGVGGGSIGDAPATKNNAGDWFTVARPAIEAHFNKYRDATEIRFNLMGIVKNRVNVFTEQRKVLLERKSVLNDALGAKKKKSSSANIGCGLEEPFVDCSQSWQVSGDRAGQELQLIETEEAILSCERALRAEEEKVATWKLENIRRKHNYVPFVVSMLRMLAEKRVIKPLVEKAVSGRFD